MLHFEGVEQFPVSPAEAAAALCDAGWLARALPDAEVTRAEPDHAAWKVRPKLTFVAGVLESTAEVLGRDGTSGVRYRIVTHGVGSGSTVEAALSFAPSADGGTEVRWAADLTEQTGLLKLVPPGLMQATTKKVMADVWAAVRVKLAGTGNRA